MKNLDAARKYEMPSHPDFRGNRHFRIKISCLFRGPFSKKQSLSIGENEKRRRKFPLYPLRNITMPKLGLSLRSIREQGILFCVGFSILLPLLGCDRTATRPMNDRADPTVTNSEPIARVTASASRIVFQDRTEASQLTFLYKNDEAHSEFAILESLERRSLTLTTMVLMTCW